MHRVYCPVIALGRTMVRVMGGSGGCNRVAQLERLRKGLRVPSRYLENVYKHPRNTTNREKYSPSISVHLSGTPPAEVSHRRPRSSSTRSVPPHVPSVCLYTCRL